MFMERFSSKPGIYPKEDVLPHPETPPKDSHGFVAVPGWTKCFDDNVLQGYQNFKHFDTVVDFSDHLFSATPMQQTTKLWDECIRKQLKNLEDNLPETIFVRTYESRNDLLRAVIIGQKGTPYHDSLFFFNMYFPPMFPRQPPVVRYHSFGLGINPHLFECGEVRLNLYSESSHLDRSLWLLSEKTILQLLVLIHDRVLYADPLLLDPGFLDSGPSVVAEYLSLLYNEDILVKSFELMVHIMHKPPKNFEAFVLGYFRDHVIDILMARRFYKWGRLQVGAKKEGCCSREFVWNLDVRECLVQTFVSIGFGPKVVSTYHNPPANSVSEYLNMHKPSVCLSETVCLSNSC